MHEVWVRYGWVVYVFVAALPVIVGVTLGTVALRRRRGVLPEVAWRDTVAEVGIVAGTAPWLFMGFIPHWEAVRSAHLLPFVDLVDQWHVGPEFFAVQVGANLLVFATAGFFAPIRWRIGPGAVLVGAAVASALLEIGQWVFDIGRVTSVDDVLVNAVGAWLAALCSTRWWARRRVTNVAVAPA
ncbi:hypothetical protein GCM10009682_04840 [Luedemannella flava]|uniref:VanZ-like domain-containing protein n=1 Tax=Luedemannella flava TaxID=349316 RepID=A0ABN2LEM3_9ACTN